MLIIKNRIAIYKINGIKQRNTLLHIQKYFRKSSYFLCRIISTFETF